MAFQTKKSVLAIVKETTEGTAVQPTAGTDFVSIQDGFSVELTFEQLESEALTGSIGKSKSAIGFFEGTSSISVYIKHSGTEGAEPETSDLLEAAMGTKEVEATEFDTVAASTVSVVKVDTAEGAEFVRGQSLLVKDSTNGWSARPVDSISSDDLTLGINLDNAPASGVNLGKAVLYTPSESHPSLSLWDYRANQAAIQGLFGARVTSLEVTSEAGQFINSSYELEGIDGGFNPITIDSDDTFIDFSDSVPTVRAVSITAKTYNDPHDLASAMQTAMNSTVSADTYTVSYSNSTGKFTFVSDGTIFSLLWSSGANTANTIGDAIGFVVSSDDTGSLTYTGDNAITLAAPFSVSLDSSNPLIAKDNELFLGDATDTTCVSAQSVTVVVDNSKADELDICQASGKSGSVITDREVTWDIVLNIQQYDADKFKRMRSGDNIKAFYVAGERASAGGNFNVGKVMTLYSPTATVQEVTLDDADGLVVVNLQLKAYVSSGLGEFFINFL